MKMHTITQSTPNPSRNVQTRSKTILGFCVSQKRFHSKIQNENISPMTYHPENVKNLCKIRPVNQPMKQKEIIEDFVRFVKKMSPASIENQRLQHDVGCPGDFDKPCCDPTSIKPRCTFGRKLLFNEKVRAPPPGTYGGNDHRPFEDYLNQRGSLRTYSRLPPFDGCMGRAGLDFKTTIAPNQYNPTEFNTISKRLINKRVSKRGPYDLFTGPRDASTIITHHPKNIKSYCEKDFYDPVEVKERVYKSLKIPKKPQKPSLRFMVFDLTTCYKEPNFPNPCTYTPKYPGELYKEKPNRFAFNCSTRVVRKSLQAHGPGPGRYWKRKKVQSKNQWPFLSKVQRGVIPLKSYNAF